MSRAMMVILAMRMVLQHSFVCMPAYHPPVPEIGGSFHRGWTPFPGQPSSTKRKEMFYFRNISQSSDASLGKLPAIKKRRNASSSLSFYAPGASPGKLPARRCGAHHHHPRGSSGWGSATLNDPLRNMSTSTGFEAPEAELRLRGEA